MSLVVSQSLSTPWALIALLRRLVRPQRTPRVPHGLDRRQVQDAGIPWELAGYGRGADVSMLPIIILESQR